MMKFHHNNLTRFACGAFALVGVIAMTADAAEMKVRNGRVRPGQEAKVTVSGKVQNEATFGWSVMVSLVPRDGATGRLEFTPVTVREATRPTVEVNQTATGEPTISVQHRRSSQVDIRQGDDAWPSVGSFTTYDTGDTSSRTMNGAVDDNGTLIAAATTFDGKLVEFPIVASSDARGTWDVILTTPVGSSGWEGLTTTLVHGTIEVKPAERTRSINRSLRKGRGNR